MARLLEAPNAERDAARLQASAAQWEYDDEYDDSFDDLATHGNEGIADAEGKHCLCSWPHALHMLAARSHSLSPRRLDGLSRNG